MLFPLFFMGFHVTIQVFLVLGLVTTIGAMMKLPVMFFMHNCCRIPALQLTTIASDGPSCRGSWTSSNKPAAAAVHCTSRAARCRKPVPRRPRRASRRSCAGRVWARSSCGVSWCLSSVRVGAASAGPRRRHRHCINKNMVAVMLKNDRAANAVENRDISVS